MKGKIQFQETQSFRNTWIWYLLIIISILTLSGVSIAIYTNPSSQGGIIALIITFISLGGVITVFATSKLVVSMDSKCIYYRFAPFINSERTISVDDVLDMRIRKYKAIWEYGGYGYRYSIKNGRALNISGYMGLQLVFSNGKKLLIGTQKPDLMNTAVNRLKENWEHNG